MARDPAERRLARILSDEEYGPKLARLRGEDERQVLRLIEENRGKEARKAILTLDERRREQQRERRIARHSREQPPIRRVTVRNREQRERDAVRRILSVFGRKAREPSVRRNVSLMTDDELDYTAIADEDGLVRRASEPATRQDNAGKDVNPFWYH